MKKSNFVAIVATLAMTSSLFAAVTIYEGWDAAIGTDITACTTGTGFSDAGWVAGTAWGSAGIAGSDSAIVAGLTYSDGGITLVTSGNAALMAPPVRTDVEDDGWFMSRTASVDLGGSVMWFSYLFMTTNASVYATDLDCGPSAGFETCATPGLHWSEAFKFVNGYDTGVVPVPNQTYFVVAKYTPAGDAELWVNPALNVEPTMGGTRTAGNYGDGVNFRIKKNGNQPIYKMGVFDEIRVGETYADVAPVVPEPSFAIFAVLAAFAARFIKK